MTILSLLFIFAGSIFSMVQASKNSDTKCSQDALAFAWAYGWPLWAYSMFTQKYDNITANVFYHQRRLANPDDLSVVRPNSDTLYSIVFVDLSSADLEVEMPEMGDRYWILPVSDIYGSNLANVGTIKNNTAGKYLIRYNPDTWGVQTENITGGYQAFMNLPTPYGIIVGRTLVTTDPGDLGIVTNLQDQMKISTIPRSCAPVAPPFNLKLFSDPTLNPGTGGTLNEVILHLTAKLAHLNPSHLIPDRPWISTLLHKAGISNGQWTQPPGTNLTAAAASANQSVIAVRSLPGIVNNLGRNWTANNIIGEYGSFYQLRYLIAQRGFLALTNDEVIYPSYPNIRVGSDEAVLVSFESKPPVTENGFWSLTPYNEEQYLIPNSLDRFVLGDRSNLTFPDGRLLSEGGDGRFEILMQPDDVRPPEKWMNNLLPIMKGGGVITFNLRFYGPGSEILNGTYVMPNVTVIKAIRGEGNCRVKL